MVELEQVAIRLMRAMDVQGLLLDEVHNILAGTFREQRIVLNTLRYLAMNCRSRSSVSASMRPARRSAAMCSWRAASRSFR